MRRTTQALLIAMTLIAAGCSDEQKEAAVAAATSTVFKAVVSTEQTPAPAAPQERACAAPAATARPL
jgi:outer membrane murein-binding lipoprotein Lpp